MPSVARVLPDELQVPHDIFTDFTDLEGLLRDEPTLWDGSAKINEGKTSAYVLPIFQGVTIPCRPPDGANKIIESKRAVWLADLAKYHQEAPGTPIPAALQEAGLEAYYGVIEERYERKQDLERAVRVVISAFNLRDCVERAARAAAAEPKGEVFQCVDSLNFNMDHMIPSIYSMEIEEIEQIVKEDRAIYQKWKRGQTRSAQGHSGR